MTNCRILNLIQDAVVLLSSKVLSTLLSDDPGQTKTGYRKIAFDMLPL